MNRIIATVTAIERSDHITIVAFDSEGQKLSMMALDLGDEICIAKKVVLCVKASHIVIAKGFEGMLSTSTQLNATVTAVENGALLCNVRLRIGSHELESIITRASSQRMGLAAGDRVTALIKASELSIAEVCSD